MHESDAALDPNLIPAWVDGSFVPADKFSLRGLIELTTEFVHDLAVSIIGPHGAKFAPMFQTIFFFILVNNLIGLIPGMSAARRVVLLTA